MTEISTSTLTLGLGELIRCKRQQQQMTLAQVSALSGVPKGTLSKIENGDLNIRDFNVALSIASALNISSEDVTQGYIAVEKNVENLLVALNHVISQSPPSMITQSIVMKLLESSRDSTDESLERLCNFTTQLKDDTQKLTMYYIISKIADDHSVRPFMAKSLLHIYLIERNNFQKLRGTYERGKEILPHARFLHLNDQITFYFKLAAHAYLLRKYKDAILFYKEMISLDKSEGELKAYAINAVAFCYFFLDQYDLAEQCLNTSKAFSFPFVKEHSEYLTAVLDGKKGNIDLAIMQLENCLDTFPVKVSIMHDLLDLYIQQKDLEASENLFQYEKNFEDMTLISNPALVTEYAKYFTKKSEFFKLVNNQKEAFNNLLQSIMMFISVDTREDVSKCAGTLLSDLCKMPNALANNEIVGKIELLSAYLKNHNEVRRHEKIL